MPKKPSRAAGEYVILLSIRSIFGAVGSAQRQHRDVDLLLRDAFPHHDLEPKLVAIKPQRLVEGPHRDTQMVDFKSVQASHV